MQAAKLYNRAADQYNKMVHDCLLTRECLKSCIDVKYTEELADTYDAYTHILNQVVKNDPEIYSPELDFGLHYIDEELEHETDTEKMKILIDEYNTILDHFDELPINIDDVLEFKKTSHITDDKPRRMFVHRMRKALNLDTHAPKKV